MRLDEWVFVSLLEDLRWSAVSRTPDFLPAIGIPGTFLLAISHPQRRRWNKAWAKHEHNSSVGLQLLELSSDEDILLVLAEPLH
jgi:hypothetical protein